MRLLWRLAITNWWANPGRTLAGVLAVALGVGVVVVITTAYETARYAIAETVVKDLLGASHVSVHPPGAHWGSLDVRLVDRLRSLNNVQNVGARLQRRMRLARDDHADPLMDKDWWSVDAVGVRPEWQDPARRLPSLVGRGLADDDRGAVLIERELATSFGLNLGDSVALTRYPSAPRKSFSIVGIFDSQRVADFQHPVVQIPMDDLQALTQEEGVVSVIEITLREASQEAIAAAKVEVERCISELAPPYPYRVETAAAREMVLTETERITRLILSLIAFIALLTSFFIILTTQMMSLVQRRTQLGVMRCIGLTRGQLIALVCAEVIPIGLAGIVLGVFGGIAVIQVLAWAVTDMVSRVLISTWGLKLAVISGSAATLLSAALVISQAKSIIPLQAVLADARPPRLSLAYAMTAFGAVFLAIHQWMTLVPDQRRWVDASFAAVGAIALHLGYVFLVPGMVVSIGPLVAHGVGRLLQLPRRLAETEFLRAPWRTTGACWVLLVGLSLIVYIGVRGESVLALWDFPARLPSLFVWSPEYVSGDVVEHIRRIPGVGRVTVSADVDCEVAASQKKGPGDSIVDRLLRKLTRPVFVAGDPDQLLSMIKVVFVEGSIEDALAKLKRGDYVVIPPQTARNYQLKVGDRVTITVGKRSADFEVAGVVQSPALDMAVTAFQAESYMQFAAATAILGTRDDLKNKLGLDVVSMFMCDLQLDPVEVPVSFDRGKLPDVTSDAAVARAVSEWSSSLPEESDVIASIRTDLTASEARGDAPPAALESRDELRRFGRAIQWLGRSSSVERMSREQQWDAFRERLTLLRIAGQMGRPQAIMGSLRRLHEQSDTLLRRAIVLITWMPSIHLIAAAVGVANLMMVSVHLRTRQIAVLRAVGAERSQIIRLVLAEAVAIGLLGSFIGVALGLHEALSVNRIAAAVVDVTLPFIIPYGTILLAVLVTVGVCLLAGIGPARYAARDNIVAAMQTA